MEFLQKLERTNISGKLKKNWDSRVENDTEESSPDWNIFVSILRGDDRLDDERQESNDVSIQTTRRNVQTF